jgi:valyl-tRNA synthetase
MKADPKKKLAAQFSSADAEVRWVIEANRDGILRLAFLSDLGVSTERLAEAGGGMRSTARFDIRVAYDEAVDVEAEKARIRKEIEKLQAAIASKERQLGNETFRSRAPENIIRNMEETLATHRIELSKLEARLKQLG